MKDFPRSHAVTYTVNVVMYPKLCKIDKLLLQSINRKFCMAYRIFFI